MLSLEMCFKGTAMFRLFPILFVYLIHTSLTFPYLGPRQTNSVDPDQNAESDQCLHCLLTGISIRNI